MKKPSTMSAQEFDQRFNEGEDITPYIESIRRPGLEPRRINVDLPSWIIAELDKQASLIGVTRQSIIKVWLSDRLREEQSRPLSAQSS